MKRRAVLSVVSGLLATTGSTSPAMASAPRRVIVAGPEEDAIAPRLQKELAALGFEAIRVGALDGCARSAVVVAAQDASATAAACSDGDQVGVWVAEGGSLRLRDVVVVREEGDPARETTAVRAGEVTRATIAMRDAEEEAARATPPPAPAPKPQPPAWDTFDRPTPSPVKPAKSVNRAPSFLVGVGMSSLMGVDASAAAFSAKAEVGLLRHITVTARVDYPVESHEVGGGSTLLVAPAFTGIGVGVPISGPDAFVIPRFGGGLGVAWVNAKRPVSHRFDPTGSFVVTTPEATDSSTSFAAFAEAGLSMRLYRPLRMTVDGVLGSTTSRLVVRDRGTHVAYWGTPFGALALRLELQFK